METITNAAATAANAASRAIWGEPTTNTSTDTTTAAESGTEPVSGKTGDVERGEPYDAGNADSTDTDTTNPSATSAVAKEDSTTSDTTKPTTVSTASLISESTHDRWAPESTSETTSGTTGATSTTSDIPGSTTTTLPIRSEHEKDKTGVTSTNQSSSAFTSDKPTSSNISSGSGALPSYGADSSSAAQQTKKFEGADRPFETPSGEGIAAVKESKEKAEHAQKADVGSTVPSGISSTSGVKGDGGNVDAAQPSAAEKAGILETKNASHGVPIQNSTSDVDDSTDVAGEGKKSGLRSKIKHILHKH